MPNQKHHVFFLCRYSAVAYSRSGRLCRKNANEVFKNAMVALALAPSWTTSSVVELLKRKELALLCQLASSAEAILRQRLFSIDSQKFGTVGRSHDHFQRGRRSFLSFDRYTHEKHKIHTLWPCARWHTQLFTEYSVKNCSPSPPGDYRNRADLTWQWSCMSILFRKRRCLLFATRGRASSSAEQICCPNRVFDVSAAWRQERSSICMKECWSNNS